MKRFILLLVVCIAAAPGVKAQKGVDTGTPFGRGADSIRCRENLSLFIGYVNSNNYKDAYPFWKAVYDECPGSHVNIYIAGVNIINWQISQEPDNDKKVALVDDMMKLFDDRIKYFGNDPRYRKDNVIGRKANIYNQLKGERSDYSLMYQWTSEAVEEFKEKTDPLAVSRFMFASFKLMQSDMEKYKDQYINDYLKCSGIFDMQLKEAETANNETILNNLKGYQAEMNQNFYASGVAECDMLVNIFTPKVEGNKDNLEFLKETMILFSRIKCEETDLYITLSEYAYQIEPTAESAMGLGHKALKDKDFPTAEKYFTEAVEMSDNSETKANLYFVLGSLALQHNQYPKAKQNLQKCINEKADHGGAYIQLAQAYATGGRGIYPDDGVKSKCIFYSVVDKLEKARQVDPSVATEANKLINTYRQYFPSKEEIFMHPDLKEGDNFTIGGWINETVKIR